MAKFGEDEYSNKEKLEEAAISEEVAEAEAQPVDVEEVPPLHFRYGGGDVAVEPYPYTDGFDVGYLIWPRSSD